MEYTIQRATSSVDLNGAWPNVAPLDIANFHPESSSHRPAVQARALYDADRIHVAFTVADQYVRCVHDRNQQTVCEDSCVEFFVEPRAGLGYFNFELNCGGTMLANHITDPTRVEGKVASAGPIENEWLSRIEITHSLPLIVEPEIVEAVVWRVALSIPFELFEAYLGSLGDPAGQTWRANFYKCGDATSHPHWASWAPIGKRLDFHQPDRFGAITFAV